MISLSNKDTDKLIVKSNTLIEASYKLTLQEKRLILLMTSMIGKDDKDFHSYKIGIQELNRIVGIENEAGYTRTKELTEKILTRVLKIKEPDGILHINWLSSAKYFEKQGQIQFRFDPALKPYLLQLKDCFTKYHLITVIQFKSFYYIRIYELLKQYESIGWRYFELDELRRILGIPSDEYKLYADIKRRILNPAKKAFDKKYNKGELDLTFDFKEVKERRKVVGIRFEIIKKQQLALDFEEQIDIPKKHIDNESLVDKLVTMNLTKRQAQNRVKKYPAERILRNIELTKHKNEKGEINNIPAFLIEAIENDFAKDYTPVNPKLAELLAEAKKCWNQHNGSCGARWSRYKDNQSSACYYCAKFEKQRNTNS